MNQVKLTRSNGVLKIDIDGKLYDPLSFKSFRPTARNISDFAKAGVKLFSILSSGMISLLKVPYSLFGESWIGDREYDFAPIDKQIELFRENAPDCYFALMLQLDTRPWYCEKYGVPYTFTNLSQTISDEKWRNDACDYMTAVINHVEEKYGDIIYGYFLMCGFTTEWFSQFDEQASSDIKLKAYRKYLNDENAVIPDREKISAPADVAFIEGESKQENIQYQKFHAELIADSILWFAGKAQEILKHKKLLGVYYGYLFELNGPRLWDAGSLSYERVFTSPDIDMISSPSSYAYRDEESTSAFMVTYNTLDMHDKLYYLEFDHITHVAPAKVGDVLIPGGNNKLKDHIQTMNVMQRDYMLCTANGAALWWFDMFEGWFYSEEMMGAIKNMIELTASLNDKKLESVAEILVIANGEGLYGVNKNSEINTTMLGLQRGGLNRMGAPYDMYSACDVDKIDIDRYKLIIFLDAFAMDDKMHAFVESVKANNKTLLWIYAPDYVEGGLHAMQLITDINVIKLIGEEDSVQTAQGTLKYDMLPTPRFFVEDNDTMPLGIYPNTEKVAIAMKRFSNYTTIYSAVGNLSGAVLRDIAKTAGVRIYSRDDNASVYVNNQLKCVYALDATELFVDDGEYKELFSGDCYLAQSGKISIPKTKYASKMFIKIK